MHPPPHRLPFSDHAKFLLSIALALAVLAAFELALHL